MKHKAPDEGALGRSGDAPAAFFEIGETNLLRQIATCAPNASGVQSRHSSAMLVVKTKLRESGIHGLGLFADQFISKGALIWQFDAGVDLEIPVSVLEQLHPVAKAALLKYAYLDGNERFVLCADDSRFLNHSLQPNITSVVEPQGNLDLAARDIHIGEELTTNYAEFDLDWERKLGQ